jgi:exodeoxyribonuclease VIII
MNYYPVSNTRLNAFKRSPLHLIHYLENGGTQTPAMAFGSAFHKALLEPDTFTTQYAVAPEVDRRSKEGKLEYDKFVYEAEDKTVISASDYQIITKMVESIRSNAVAHELLSACHSFERNVEWTNFETEVPMRGIVDAMSDEFIIDVKTTTDASPSVFSRDVFRNYYHRQAAIYLDAFGQTHKLDFYFIAIEKNAPYGVSVFQLDSESIQNGYKLYLEQISEYKAWVEAGAPAAGYDYWHYSGIHQLELPKYLQL